MLCSKCLHVCLHIDWVPYCTFKVANNGTLCTDKSMRSKDFYNVFRSQITDSTSFTRISNYLAAYCESDKEIHAFSRIVSHEKEI